MANTAALRPDLNVVPMLAHESLYVGIDIGKHFHVAGFLSNTLLRRHERFEACPAQKFDQSREGFRLLVDRIRAYVPLEQCYVLLEHTGHYHKPLEQYLLELDIPVFVIHVQERQPGLLKSDKRDALHLANLLYNQLEKGIQVADKTQLVRRMFPPTEAASQLKGLTRHRYELMHESTQRKNKLVAICDELFPELTQVFKDPNGDTALCYREQFPTPHALATASIGTLAALKRGWFPTNVQLLLLQELAAQSIGTKDVNRQRSLVFEQTQLIKELRLLQGHVKQIDAEIKTIVELSREGQILLSMQIIGVVQAAMIIAAIGSIANFKKASELKAYFGWAPQVDTSGTSLNKTRLTPSGKRTIRQVMFLIVGNAIRMDCEWSRLYERLVPQKCRYDEKTRTYKGKLKVIGRIAGQMIEMIYAFLKHDQEALSKVTPGEKLSDPMLYDPTIHQKHRRGEYRPLKKPLKRRKIIFLPPKSW